MYFDVSNLRPVINHLSQTKTSVSPPIFNRIIWPPRCDLHDVTSQTWPRVIYVIDLLAWRRLGSDAMRMRGIAAIHWCYLSPLDWWGGECCNDDKKGKWGLKNGPSGLIMVEAGDAPFYCNAVMFMTAILVDWGVIFDELFYPKWCCFLPPLIKKKKFLCFLLD